MGLLGLLLFLVWTWIIFAVDPKNFYRIWIGLPVLGLVLLISLGVGILFYQSLPSVVFRGSIGFTPTADVKIVNSLRHEPIDSDDTYLEFYASDSTISRILQNGFAPIDPIYMIEYSMTPEWWKPPMGPGTLIYATDTDGPQVRDIRFESYLSHKLLIYDPSSGTPNKRLVYFRYRR